MSTLSRSVRFRADFTGLATLAAYSRGDRLFTSPEQLAPFPQFASATGNGDTENAANFVCR
jgi:hypothetical protein